MIASCDARGVIVFAQRVPAGHIEIARGPARAVRNLIEGTARLARDNKTWLVPGVPETQGVQTEGIKALQAYLVWIAKSETPGVLIAGCVAEGAIVSDTIRPEAP